jgi:NitT/TauT family transport system substrate-binding protein
MNIQKVTRFMLVAFLIGAVTLFISCGNAGEVEKKTEETKGGETKETLPKLTVGIQVSPAMTLVMVAEDKGFFDKAGVDVEIKEFTAGKFALQAFLGGSLDIAISGEVPVTLSSLQGNKFRVLAQVVEKQSTNAG